MFSLDLLCYNIDIIDIIYKFYPFKEAQVKLAFLILGILLSASSKLLQFVFESDLGDLLVLPAATFFVLAILLYNKKFCAWLEQPAKRKDAQKFAMMSCLFVLSFQLFTMFAFGRGEVLGYVYIAPLLGFAAIGFVYFQRLIKE